MSDYMQKVIVYKQVGDEKTLVGIGEQFSPPKTGDRYLLYIKQPKNGRLLTSTIIRVGETLDNTVVFETKSGSKYFVKAR